MAIAAPILNERRLIRPGCYEGLKLVAGNRCEKIMCEIRGDCIWTKPEGELRDPQRGNDVANVATMISTR